MPKSFISYCHKDDDKRIILDKLLKSNRLSPIVVASRTKPSMLLAAKVEQAIDEADFLIPILTGQSINNQWVNQEIGYANKLTKSNKIKIIPIVEESIMNQLKGFIHKQLDLPFTFKTFENNEKTNKEFRFQCLRLIEYLKSNKTLKKYDVEFKATLSSLFWKSYYQYKCAFEASLLLENTGNTIITIRKITFPLTIVYRQLQRSGRSKKIVDVKKTFLYESNCYGLHKSIILHHRPLILKPGELKNLYNFVFIPTKSSFNDCENLYSYGVKIDPSILKTIPMKFISTSNEIFKKDVEILPQ